MILDLCAVSPSFCPAPGAIYTTYFGVLALFLTLPLVWLLAYVARDLYQRLLMGRPVSIDRRAYIVVLLHVIMALVYTTPWDNYLLANGVWFYDPQRVSGVFLGYVPIEEYCFFVLQTLLVGLWTLRVRSYLKSSESLIVSSLSLRLRLTIFAFGVWLVAIVLWIIGWKPGTYLALILAWGLIPVLIQLGFGGDILWTKRRLVAWAMLPPTVYLWLLDWVAISNGVWQLDPDQTTGLALAGLPLEEMLFFLITNLIITCGVVLMVSEVSYVRARALRQQVWMRWQRFLSFG